MSLNDLPTLNATLNGISAVFLLIGYYRIRTGNREGHRQMMTCALVTSVLFLTSYLIYHYNVGAVPYPHQDWTRLLYFFILIPHIILAAVNVPFVLIVATRGFKGRYASHKRLARWIWPLWMFVCISGIVIYGMLYHLPPLVVPVDP